MSGEVTVEKLQLIIMTKKRKKEWEAHGTKGSSVVPFTSSLSG